MQKSCFVLALLLGTSESKIAAKKTHKMEKSADFLADFHLNSYQFILFGVSLIIIFLVSFVRR